MVTTIAPRPRIPDVANQIVHAMRSMNIAPIPRNYEMFYEAYIGSNPALTRDLTSLGNRPSQEQLDALGERYFSTAQQRSLEKAHDRIRDQLEAVFNLLTQEQKSLANYNRLLDETCNRITTRTHSSVELLQNAISILSEATGLTIASGEKTVAIVSERSREMAEVRQELDEYKRIANTDSLTRLANRRAFDDRLALLYDNGLPRNVVALVLADIDHFKRINDTFGHPVGDKILAMVASIIRNNVRKDVFVARTGGEEFAIVIEGNTHEEVTGMCERIRTNLEKTPLRHSRTGIDYGTVTMSLGFAMAAQASDPGELYALSDAALYKAKNSGRNRTVQYDENMSSEYVGKGWLIYK